VSFNVGKRFTSTPIHETNYDEGTDHSEVSFNLGKRFTSTPIHETSYDEGTDHSDVSNKVGQKFTCTPIHETSYDEGTDNTHDSFNVAKMFTSTTIHETSYHEPTHITPEAHSASPTPSTSSENSYVDIMGETATSAHNNSHENIVGETPHNTPPNCESNTPTKHRQPPSTTCENPYVNVVGETQPSHPIFRPLANLCRQMICKTNGMSVMVLNEVFANVGTKCTKTPLVEKIVGDGNCLFRALSYWVTGDEDSHYTIRSKLCKFIHDNPTSLSDYMQAEDVQFIGKKWCSRPYLTRSKMNMWGVWGTSLEIQAAAKLFQRDIYVFVNGRSYHRFAAKEKPTLRSMYIAHVNGNHFDVITGPKTNIPPTPQYIATAKRTPRPRRQLKLKRKSGFVYNDLVKKPKHI
jgi:hypothetical protein